MKKTKSHVKGIIYIIVISCILVVGDVLYVLYIQHAGYPLKELELTQIEKVTLYFDYAPGSDRRYPTYDLPENKIEELVDILHTVKVYGKTRKSVKNLPVSIEIYLNDSVIIISGYKQLLRIDNYRYWAEKKSGDAITDFFLQCYQTVVESSKLTHPFKDLTVSQVKNFRIYFGDKPWVFSEEAKEAFVEALNDVVIYGVEKNSVNYNGGGIDFEMELKDGTRIFLAPSNIFLTINDVVYRAEPEPVNRICQIYDDYYRYTVAEVKQAESTP